MSQLVVREDHKRIAVLSINNPPVNALSPGVPEAIEEELAGCLDDDAIDAVILAGEGRTFVAGADIRELEKMASGEAQFDASLQQFLDRVEKSTKPLICAIHGTALGGGLELAMACHWRVALESATVGQPEIKLGLIPGAAGTQRLPRLVGISRAAEMCALGEAVDAKQAQFFGLLDQVFTSDLIEHAIQFAENIVENGIEIERTCDRDELVNHSNHQHDIQDLRERLDECMPGQLAPGLAIDAVVASSTMGFSDGCRHELELFDECMNGSQAMSLIRLFFAQRKVPFRPSKSATTKLSSVERVLLIGKLPALQTWKKVLKEAAFEHEHIDVAIEYEEVMSKCDRFAPDVLLLGSNQDGWSTVGDVAERARKEFLPGGLTLVANPIETDVTTGSANSLVSVPVVALESWPQSRVLEFFAPSDFSEETQAQLFAFAKRLQRMLIQAQSLGVPIGRRLWQSAELEAQSCVQQGASPSQIFEAWRDYGFLRQPVLVSMTDSESHDDSMGERIVQRCVDAMTNEAVKIVGEGCVVDDLTLDMVAVYGAGFPTFRGGPLWQLNDLGADETLDRVTRYAEEAESNWTIPSAWQDRLSDR